MTETIEREKNHSLLYWNKHQLLWDVTAIKRIRGWWPSLPSHMSTGKSNSSSSVSCFLPFKNTSGNMIRFVKLKEVSRLKNYHNNLVFVFVFHCCDTLKGRNIFLDAFFLHWQRSVRLGFISIESPLAECMDRSRGTAITPLTRDSLAHWNT